MAANNNSDVISREIAKIERNYRGHLNPVLQMKVDKDRKVQVRYVSVTFDRVPLELFTCREGQDALCAVAIDLATEAIKSKYNFDEDALVPTWITLDPIHPQLMIEVEITD